MLYAEDGITGRSLPGAEIRQGTLLKCQQCKMSVLKWKCQRDHDLRVLWMEHSWHSIKIQSCPLWENVYIKRFLLCDCLCLDSALLLFPGINSSDNFCTLSRLSLHSKPHQISGSKSGKLQTAEGNEESEDIPERQKPAFPSGLGLKLNASS